MVKGASWSASYDSRVTSEDLKLELHYYGNIVNNSGEDWDNVSLSLSTAQVSIAGHPPELTTKIVSFKTYYDYNYSNKPAAYLNVAPSMPMTQQKIYSPDLFPNPLVSAYADEEGPDYMAATTEKTNSNATSSTFNIPRKATILSDNKPHKVTIRLMRLKSQYTYTIIPKLSVHAYLKANVRNKYKEYSLLSGPMNVFVDNNFVAKSSINTVSPGESFSLFLGTDPAIKIEYQTLKQFKDQTGFLLSKVNKTDVRFNIVVSNTKSKDIKVNVFDNLPKSNDNQVKVSLIEPALDGDKAEGASVSMTAANNIQWIKKIPANTKISLPFHYVIEYPVDKEIDNAW